MNDGFRVVQTKMVFLITCIIYDIIYISIRIFIISVFYHIIILCSSIIIPTFNSIYRYIFIRNKHTFIIYYTVTRIHGKFLINILSIQ